MFVRINLAGIKFYFLFFLLVSFSSILNLFFYDFSEIPKRSFAEPLIYLFNVFTFYIIPKKLISLNHSFFKIFDFYFTSIILVGYLDFVLQIFGFDFISRGLFDYTDVGLRYHSFFGEPRDAFVVLCSFLFFVLFTNFYFKNIFNIKKYLILIIPAIILTQSASGILGIFIGLFLYVIFSFSLRKIITNFFLIFLIVFIVLFAINISNILGQGYYNRFMLYYEAFQSLYNLFLIGEIPQILKGQVANVIPVLMQFENLINYNFLNLFFGYGTGMSSYFSSNYLLLDETTNPASQIVRIFFELGFLGLIFMFFIIREFYQFLKIKLTSQNIQLAFFIFIGTNLSHRSNSFLIIFLLSFLVLEFYKKMNFER